MIKEPPYGILTNIPDSFFKENGITPEQYLDWYLKQDSAEGPIFYHFISSVPVWSVFYAYICFGGKVQFKAGILEFLKNKPLEVGGYSHPTPRDWMVTCAPIVKPPKDIPMRGFRGFRYTHQLF